MKPLLFLLALFALFFAALYMQAQTTGTLAGQVSDTGGAGIPGARVEIVGTSLGTITKPNGNFVLTGIRAGTYRVRISSVGKKTQERQTTIAVGDTTRLNVMLEEEPYQGETVHVIADKPVRANVLTSGARTDVERTAVSEGTTTSQVGAILRDASMSETGGTGIRGGRANIWVAQREGITTAAGEGETTPDEGNSAEASSTQATLFENPFRASAGSPYSTFSIDVDNASYSNVRGYLSRGTLPPADAVRIEELINYFDYNYPDPAGDDPFAFHSEVVTCPWNSDHLVVRLALQGKRIHPEQAPPSNLVFLIDVSGSMKDEKKLPLLKQAFERFVDALRPQDHVAIVVYAGAAGLVLESTPGSEKTKIKEAISRLQSGGSTAGGEGILLAYKTAADNFLPEGNNRVILATDGDFNVGVSSDSGLVGLIEEKRKEGVFLSVLGFGTGNYQDTKMEKLADNGNGNYYYIDRLAEGERVLVSEMSGTLYTIAKDVKLQIKFNPAKVVAYRLIGYENRILAARDFDDDAKDAGELGAGHTVTALYEVVPVGAEIGFELDTTKKADYQLDEKRPELLSGNDLLLARLRYKEPNDSASKLIEHLVKDERKAVENAEESTRFAMAVALWGMLLRNSRYAVGGTYESAEGMARSAMKKDAEGYRKEFLELIAQTRTLAPSPAGEKRP